MQNAFNNPLVALHDVTLQLLTEQSSDNLLNAILDQAVEFTQADSGTIALLNDTRKFLEIKAYRGFEHDIQNKVKLKLGEGVTGRCILTGKTRNVGDTRQDPHYIEVRPDIHSELAVPLTVGGKSFGVISVDSKRLNAFNVDHEEYLELLASYAAQIFTSTSSVETLAHRTHIQDILLEISGFLGKYADVPRFFEEVIRILEQKIKVSRAAIFLYDDVINELYPVASLNYSDDEKQKGRYSPGEGVTGSVFKNRRTISIPDIASDVTFLNKTGHVRHNEMQSFFAAPIILGDQPRGVFNMEIPYSSKSKFEDYTFLTQILSSLFAQALQIQKLIEQSNLKVQEENLNLKAQLKKTFMFDNIIGHSAKMEDLFNKMLMAADSPSSVLLVGESGTGKELIATALHQNSIRANHPLVKINCAAIPADLLESELFGYNKGAFTGATDEYKGKILAAHKGTLFLDEIGEMELKLQAKILRVLQEREFSPLGSNKILKADVRIIAATNANLENMIKEKKFREDLYYRLNVIRLEIPPLRERPDDLPVLVNHLVSKIAGLNKKTIKGLSSQAFHKLNNYSFPGNIRELENILERAIVLSQKNIIDEEDLLIPESSHLENYSEATRSNVRETQKTENALQETSPSPAFNIRTWIRKKISTSAPGEFRYAVVSDIEKELIMVVLQNNLFNKRKTSNQLGINRITLDRKIEEYNIMEIMNSRD